MPTNAPPAAGPLRCAAAVISLSLLWVAPAAGQSLADIEPLGSDGHVVIIVVDGLRPDLIVEHAPTIARLAAEGAASFDARTVRPIATLPSITSMLTGLTPREHRVMWNAYDPERGTVEATTVFDIAHKAGLRTALFSGKVKIRHAVRPDSVDEMIARFLPDASIAVLARSALSAEPPNLMLVHLPNVDRAGHEFGWRSDNQRMTLQAADTALASIIDALETLVAAPSRVILTADHGGEGRNHYRILNGNQRVPWILWGEGVAPMVLGSVDNTITAAVALHTLGLGVPPGMDRPDR